MVFSLTTTWTKLHVKNDNLSFIVKFIFKLVIFFLLVVPLTCSWVLAEGFLFELCPLCTNHGELICPVGYEAGCQNEIEDYTEPRCLFFQGMYIPGCWKYIGTMSLDFSLLPESLPKGAMLEVIGGGEIFTLNREIVGCKKL